MRKARNSAPRLSAIQPLARSVSHAAALAAAVFGTSSAWAQQAPAPQPKAQPETETEAPAPKAPADETKAPAKPAEGTKGEPAPTAPSEEGEPAQDEDEDASPATDEEGDEDETAGEEVDEETAGEEVDEEVDGATPTRPGFSPTGATGGTTAGGTSGAAFGAYPNPAEDEKALRAQGEERPKAVEHDGVFAEDWWSHTRPTLELHGNFRVRTGIYHNFHLNRIDSPGSAIWPRPADHYYEDLGGTPRGAQVCTPDEAKTGDSDSPANAEVGCNSPTQGGANMRFRLEPTIVISDNLRIRSQIDLLGNLVLGSTPQGEANFPHREDGYAVGQYNGYGPISSSTTSQTAPVSGINSLRDAITVQRAWAEYETPVGELKFGRMPDHWGLGILRNAGDDLDGDYQSTVDRIAFFTGLPSRSLYVGGAWDFMNEGPTSEAFTPDGGQPYDLSQRDDLTRLNLMLFRRMDDQLEQLALSKGKIVLNGGLYLSYQWQRLANDVSGPSATCEQGASAIDCQPGDVWEGYVRRGFKLWTPDLYAELKYKKFYFGIEGVTHQGKYDSLGTGVGDYDYEESPGEENGWRINQWAFALEIEQKLVEDRLKLGFYSGWASGDGDVESLVPPPGVQEQIGDRTYSTFRFHPGYRVDLILNRHLLSRVQGSYYFKPMAQYDFIRKANGLKLGGRAEAIWTRASNFMQAPGHQRDLGIELNGTVYFQSSDGVLNDREDLKGGFYSMVQYGVLFPLSGLGYQDQQTANAPSTEDLRLKAAQMVRGFLGVAF